MICFKYEIVQKQKNIFTYGLNAVKNTHDPKKMLQIKNSAVCVKTQTVNVNTFSTTSIVCLEIVAMSIFENSTMDFNRNRA